MSGSPSIIIVGVQQEEEAFIRQQVGDMVEISAVEPDPTKGLEAVRANQPSLAVLFLDNDPEAIFDVTSQIKLDGCTTMIVSRQRDPERILRAMRSGAKDFAYLEEGNDDVRRAILNLSLASPAPTAQPASARGTVVAVFGCKGGVGATAIATGLAGALLPEGPDQKGQVVLLDVNFQMGDVLVFLDLASRYTWRDLINNLHRLDEDLLHQSLTVHQHGVYVVSQSDAVEEADELSPAGIAKAIAFLRRHFEFVVVDGLRDFSETSLVVLDLADKVLLTMTQDIPALKNANRCMGIFRQLRYGPDKLKLVVNRYQKRGSLDIDSIADALGVNIDATVANDFPTVIKSINEGALLVTSAPRSRVAKDVRSLVTLVRGERPTRKRGLFGRRG